MYKEEEERLLVFPEEVQQREGREDHKERRHVHFSHNKRGNSFGPVTHIEIKDELIIARKAKVKNPSIITHKTRPQNGADRDDRERDI